MPVVNANLTPAWVLCTVAAYINGDDIVFVQDPKTGKARIYFVAEAIVAMGLKGKFGALVHLAGMVSCLLWINLPCQGCCRLLASRQAHMLCAPHTVSCSDCIGSAMHHHLVS